jgi:hypothetical protein
MRVAAGGDIDVSLGPGDAPFYSLKAYISIE